MRLSPDLTEAQLQEVVLDYARWHHWLAVHIRATEFRKGQWAVPYQGDPGLPDLIMARAGRFIGVELKSEKGRATAKQLAWLAAGGDNCYLWRPSSGDEIEAVLGAPLAVAA